jgi:formate transporter
MGTDNMDTLLPPEMALKAEQIGAAKASMSAVKTFILAILAGSFIALGAVFFTVVTTGVNIPFGIARLLGGVVFSLGLVLVLIAGAELFTGNNLIVMAWANKKVSTKLLLRNWALVFPGNFIGALFIVVLILLAQQYNMNDGELGLNIMKLAAAKCRLGFVQAVASGVICNILVCLAVWLCFSATSSSARIMCIILPVSAFVAAGFEHSIANMYFVPVAILLQKYAGQQFLILLHESGIDYSAVTWHNFILHNLLPVTIGNIIGGAGLVGLVYWFVYLKKDNSL